MDYDNKRRSSAGPTTDDPPLSRLFIIGPKTLKEDDYREHFDKFGTIEDLWMVKDRNSGENKGIAYIKFAKTSEAAAALEEMNGKSLGSGRITVKIAASREKGATKDTYEEEKTLRLFVACPKSMTDEELSDYFKQFGDLDYVNIVKDRNTRESKGIAYVKYHKFSHAAKALEECDRKYKAVFAEPKKTERETKRESFDFSGSAPAPVRPSGGRSFNVMADNLQALTSGASGINEGYTKLTVIAHHELNQDQLWKLFDIVPGMDYCDIKYEGDNVQSARAVGQVVYKNSQLAAHAREKLHGFEYPQGFRLIVKPAFDVKSEPLREAPKKDLLNIAETLAQATSLIKAAGLDPAALLNLGGVTQSGRDLNCSVDLPDPRPLADIDSECRARCFIVCTRALPNEVLRDLFSRFGHLIEAYMLAGKNCGYARYAQAEAAEDAVQTLHGADVNGVRLKVVIADEQRKRQRTD